MITNPDGSRSAALGGLVTCGSVWACPVCAAKIATRRADDLATVMRAMDDLGGSAFMLTLTMRHARGDRLGLNRAERARRNELEERRADREIAHLNGWDVDDRAAEAEAIELDSIKAKEGCWDALGYAWSAVTSGSSWSKDADLFGGLLGWARAVEVTDGTNGWHVHVHMLLTFADPVSAEIVAAGVGARMFGRWRRALERRGSSASDEHGWDLRRAQLGDGDLADFFVKMAHEITSGHCKDGRHGGRTPMQLLAEAVDTYEETAVVGVGDLLRRPPATHVVHRPARPEGPGQPGRGCHRRGDRRGGPGRRRPPWADRRHLGLAPPKESRLGRGSTKHRGPLSATAPPHGWRRAARLVLERVGR